VEQSQFADPTFGRLVFAAAAGVWFTYFRLKQRGAQPFWLMLACLVAGYGAAFLALLAFGQLEAHGFVADWCALESSWSGGAPMSLAIAAVEEGSKLLGLLAVVAVSRRHLHRAKDAVLLACCAGVGFAAAENMWLCQQGLSMVEGLARAAAAPVTHALFAAPWGLGLGLWIRRRQPGAFAVGVAVSVSAHGLYNLLLARHVPQAIPAGLILGLWVWLLRLTPTLVRTLRSSHSASANASGPLAV
jgi:RsiW-degrading membrane proteinase PrsW (M82 family)